MDDLSFEVDLVAQGEDNNFHIPNLPGEDFRRVLAQTTSEKSPLNTRVKLVEVHHGQMVHEEEECLATLLVFEFRFQSTVTERRYKSVSVTLEFLDKAGNPRNDPSVVDLAPDRMHWLNKTTYDRRTKYAASTGLTAGGTVASADTKVEWEMEQTKPLKFKATLTGQPGRSKGKNGDENAVTWTMQENADAADGVPSFLQTAVLLKRSDDNAFVAKLRVQSEVDFVSAGLRTLPARTDRDKIIDPVVFTPGKIQVRNNSVTGITEEDLEHMETVEVHRFFQVNLSEEDALIPAAHDATAGPAEAATPATGADADEEGATGDAASDEKEPVRGEREGATCAIAVEQTPPEDVAPKTPVVKNLTSPATPTTSSPEPARLSPAITAALAATEAAERAAQAAEMAAQAAAAAARAAAKAAEAARLAITSISSL